MRIYVYLLLAVLGFSQGADAQWLIPPHNSTPAETANAYRNNYNYQIKPIQRRKNVIPVPDVAPFTYILINHYGTGEKEAIDLRLTLAKHLPKPVKLVVLAHTSEAQQAVEMYRPILGERLIVATDNDPNVRLGFWARDSYPTAVFDRDLGDTQLVAADYFRPFASWAAISASTAIPFEKHAFTMVGGNFMVGEDGTCFVVDSRRRYGLTDETLKNVFGCTRAVLLPHLRGIGDSDEVIKPLPGKVMLTNVAQYKPGFEQMGYRVIMVPVAEGGSYRTHMNSMIVGNTVFMPAYGVASDTEAAKVYQSLGYNVVPIQSARMSDGWQGSVHCQIAAYPKMKLRRLLDAVGGTLYYGRE